MRRILRAWLILGRVSNLPTVWSNALVAWLLAGGANSWGLPFLWVLLGASLLYVGGTTLNDFFDVAFDRKHRQERPIPSGVLTRRAVGLVGFTYLILGGLCVCLGAGGSGLWLGCLVAAILLYDFKHKEWVGSVVVMGACRFFLVLLIASCLAETLNANILIYAAALMAYIVGLSFAARGESREAALSLWPLALLATPLLAMTNGNWSWWLAVSVACFVACVSHSLRTLTNRQDQARIGKAVAQMLAGIALADMMFAATAGGAMGVGLAFLCWVTALQFQRVVPAT